MKEKDKKLMKNTLVLGLGTICTKGMMFIMTPFFTRWLTQEEYGTFDLIITYISLLIPLVTCEIGQAAYRFLMKDDENKENIINNTLFITIIGNIISLILILILCNIYLPIKNISVALIVYTISETFNISLTMIIRGVKKLHIYAIANIIYVITMIISVTICVKILKLQLSGIIGGYAIGYTLSNIYLLTKLKEYKSLSIKNIDYKKIKNMLKYSIPLIPCDISWWIMNVSDRTIVSIFLGSASNAILAVANKIPNICQSIFGVFHLSWQENVIETIRDDDKELYYTNIMNRMLVVLISISIVILSLNFLFFNVLFTSNYFLGYYQVPILIVSIIFSMLAQFIGSIYIANMNSKKSGYTTIISAIVNIAVHLILIKYINLYAASTSTLISYLFLFIIRYIDINKYIKIRFEKSSLYVFSILLYFIICTYINNIYINYINIILSVIIFTIINKGFLIKILKRVKK